MKISNSLRLEHKLRRLFSLAPYDIYQSIKYRYFNILSKAYFRNYLQNHTIKKLQIGCGFNILEDWLNTDLEYKKNEIGFLNASKRFPFRDNTFDFIYSEHIFEHLNFEQESNMLLECFRVLKPNGVIRLATPNLKFLIQLYQDPDNEIHKDYINWSLHHFLPNVKSRLQFTKGIEIYVINNFVRAWDHQIIHDQNSLRELFNVSGFKEISVCQTGTSEFSELKNLEKHENIVGSKFNELETLIIEARK